jgi:hypothetical protein
MGNNWLNANRFHCLSANNFVNLRHPVGAKSYNLLTFAEVRFSKHLGTVTSHQERLPPVQTRPLRASKPNFATAASP